MYNEEENVATTTEAIRTLLNERLDAASWELVLVNDGSTDRTEAMGQALAAADEHVQMVSYQVNRGRGFAIRQGFAAAEGEYVVTIDSDLSYGPEHIITLFDALRENPEVDAVLGSCYMEGGTVKDVPGNRLFLSKMGNVVLSTALGGRYKTITCILRGYRRETLMQLDLSADRKDIHLEILSNLIALGKNVLEIPAHLVGRQKGSSKLKVRSTMLSHLTFSFFERPMLLFGVIGLALVLFGFVVGAYLIVQWQQGSLTEGRPLFFLLVILILGGVQILSFGFLAIMLGGLRKEIVKVQRAYRELAEKVG